MYSKKLDSFLKKVVISFGAVAEHIILYLNRMSTVTVSFTGQNLSKNCLFSRRSNFSVVYKAKLHIYKTSARLKQKWPVYPVVIYN